MKQRDDTPFRTRALYLPSGLVIWIALTATFAVSRWPPFLHQAGAAARLAELAGILAIYLAAIVFASKLKTEQWEPVQRAVSFGLLSAVVETSNIVLENVAPQLFRHPAVSIGLMVVTFLIWAAAAVWKNPASAGWKGGLIAAIASASLCMLIAVAIGFPIELFIKPPDPAIVAMWSEYQRSGWTSPRLFALANTFDSGFIHLLLAPFVACVFGGVPLLAMRAIPRKNTASS
jgi:hypothetical protein